MKTFSKGIILAGGSGTRLLPMTSAVSKQLLPVYDKPLIYYPLTTLIQAGIRHILVITTPDDTDRFRTLLANGAQFGLSIEYAAQERPAGIADALRVAGDFIAGDPVALILGDNLFCGPGMLSTLRQAQARYRGATILAYQVQDPGRYGIVELDQAGRPISIEEKPPRPRSNYAVPGLYFYDGKAVDLARTLVPSPRGELEISDLNRAYLCLEELRVLQLDAGTYWLDAGTPESLYQATRLVRTLQLRGRTMIGCPEEAAFREGFLGPAELMAIAEESSASYREHLKSVSRKEV